MIKNIGCNAQNLQHGPICQDGDSKDLRACVREDLPGVEEEPDNQVNGLVIRRWIVLRLNGQSRLATYKR